jgi:NAD-dependent DNA ligase
MKELKLILILLCIGAIGVGFYLTNKSDSPQLGSLEETTEVKEDAPVEKQKAEIEELSEIGEKAAEKVEQWSKNQEKKDSIKRANREEVLVYQIGMPKSSPEELWDNYKKLQGFGNVCLLKASRRSYYLIKHEGYNKEQIADHEHAAKEYLQSVGVNEEIKIIDLTSLCTRDDGAKLGKSERVNKEKIPCYVCK